jgi:sugar diacid utilization regulator/putative methionine-R-sulfoxide reductase with GAF domain
MEAVTYLDVSNEADALSAVRFMTSGGQGRDAILQSLALALSRLGDAEVVDLFAHGRLGREDALTVGAGVALRLDPARELTMLEELVVATAVACLDRLALEEQIRAEMVEVGLLRTVATRILAARSLEEALAAVTHETRLLLDSDIAGVMLGDGEEIVMRGCAGNQRVETANLRMRRGQGLAGLVLATGRPERVDDYVASGAISDDFHTLAHDERVQCAMGVPIRVNAETIGVLEVWRRRAHPYSDIDTARLVSMSDLAAIAFNSATMHEANRAALLQIESAHEQLEAQYTYNQTALNLQQRLLEQLIGDTRLTDLLRVIWEATGGRVHLLDVDLEHLASQPLTADSGVVVKQLTWATRQTGIRACHTVQWTERDGRSLAFKDVTVGGELVAWLCLETDAKPHDQALSLALAQASLACALHHLQEQAGARARAEQREGLVADLLDGSPDIRRGAMSRAKHINVDLRGPLRVCMVTLRSTSGRPATKSELRQGQRTLSETFVEHGISRGLLAIHDQALVSVTRSLPLEEIRRVFALACAAAEATGCLASCGVSSEWQHPLELDRAREEAVTALRMSVGGPETATTLFDDLGIIGLLGTRATQAGMSRFVADTLGAVIAYDTEHRSALILTLSTYLDSNCSQRRTAECLFVHQKTVRYRLTLVEKLSGLDLSTHRDRLLADIAVQASRAGVPPNVGPSQALS